jgi:hypothetical protein
MRLHPRARLMPRNSNGMREELRRTGAADESPTGEEARAQRRATSMPIVWLGVGVAIILAFVAALAMRVGAQHATPAAPAPVKVTAKSVMTAP